LAPGREDERAMGRAMFDPLRGGRIRDLIAEIEGKFRLAVCRTQCRLFGG